MCTYKHTHTTLYITRTHACTHRHTISPLPYQFSGHTLFSMIILFSVKRVCCISDRHPSFSCFNLVIVFTESGYIAQMVLNSWVHEVLGPQPPESVGGEVCPTLYLTRILYFQDLIMILLPRSIAKSRSPKHVVEFNLFFVRMHTLV